MGERMMLGLIQVRLGSSRLPKKALMPVMGRPLLSLQIERMRMARRLDDVAIATSVAPENQAVVAFAKENRIKCYAGSEKDLVDRVYQAAKQFKADAVLKIGADCPLCDPALIDRMVDLYQENSELYDYFCNMLKPTFPDGLDMEVLPLKTLERAWITITDPFWRESFARYMIDHPQEFDVLNMEHTTDLSGLRWTVDYEEDLRFVTGVFERLYRERKDFGMEDILALLKKEPALAEINARYTRAQPTAKPKEPNT